MDKIKILALSLITADNVFGMNDPAIEISYPGIQYNPGSVGYVVERESFVKIYKMAYDATVLAIDGKITDQDILQLAKDILDARRARSGNVFFVIDAYFQALEDAGNDVKLANESIENLNKFSSALRSIIDQY